MYVNTHNEKLFTIQKHNCMRILFGDKEADHDKFKTACSTRPIETQICLETLQILKTKILLISASPVIFEK